MRPSPTFVSLSNVCFVMEVDEVGEDDWQVYFQQIIIGFHTLTGEFMGLKNYSGHRRARA